MVYTQFFSENCLDLGDITNFLPFRVNILQIKISICDVYVCIGGNKNIVEKALFFVKFIREGFQAFPQ